MEPSITTKFKTVNRNRVIFRQLAHKALINQKSFFTGILTCRRRASALFQEGKKKRKLVFKHVASISGDVDVSIHKFPDFFVLSIEFIAQLVVIEGFKAADNAIEHSFSEDI